MIYGIVGVVVFIFLVLVLDYHFFFKKRREVERQFKRVQTSFGEVEYLDWGNPLDPPILIAYGGGTGIDFIYALDWLKDAGFRLIAVNRPGYYGLPVHSANSIEEHAAIYHEVVKHLGLERVHVFGLSMGGLSALYYAQQYPTDTLVLWCAITGAYTVNQESVDSPLGKIVMSDKGKAIISWMLVRSAKFMPRSTMASFIRTEANLEKKEIDKLAKMIVEDKVERRRMLQFITSMTPMGKVYDGMMSEVRLAEVDNGIQWEAISAPVLAIASTVDKDVSMDHVERVKEQLEDAEIVLVKNAGHFIWWGEEKDKVIEKTITFFKGIR